MAFSLHSVVLILFLVFFSCAHPLDHKEKKSCYIVHMSKSEMPTTYTLHSNWYDSCLKSAAKSAEMLYTYNTIIHGFSTQLTRGDAETLAKKPGVVSVFPSKIYKIHTTRTPSFLGIDGYDQELLSESTTSSDVVIGVLDTGAWPESKSYNDQGVGPIPSNWKGECETSKDFSSTSCNRKLIGARCFSKGYEAEAGPIDEYQESKSPRDNQGHGTHTSTTAAGSAVANASLFGYAAGTARGMASKARVAVYKVCWKDGCSGADILAAMEKAIEDGVHVLSLSIGGEDSDYFSDPIASGAFTAMEKGILVSCAAGNSGPSADSLSNVAPWITTVGAGTLDRDFPAIVTLGNGKNYSGISLYDYKGKPSLPNKMVDFVYAGNASTAFGGNFCMDGTLIPEKVAGKIVLCDGGGDGGGAIQGVAVKEAGGIGMVLANAPEYGEELIAEADLLPASGVGLKAGDEIKSYLFSDPNPTATIMFAGTKLGVHPAPVVALFSSRGPNSITPEILKPDIIGPGVNILAGWSGSVGPTRLPEDTRRVEFNIVSGTSMSCPHISGLAGLLKAAHPEWSPAAIRSALMTTAYNTYKSGQPLLDMATGNASTPFDHGAGHVDVMAALDPGLIYDLKTEDYLDFLCALGYTPAQIRSLAKSNFTCDSSKKYRVADLNYPSFGVVSSYSTAGTTLVLEHKRTLTNVGTPGTYNASSAITTTGQGKDAVKITIEPDSLTFNKMYEKLSYKVRFTTNSMPPGTNVFGRIEWSDGKHSVGSPVAVSWNQGRKEEWTRPGCSPPKILTSVISPSFFQHFILSPTKYLCLVHLIYYIYLI